MNWSAFDDCFITSDFHFWHKNILKYEPNSRNFRSLEEMNEAILEQVDALPNGSTLINLGDLYLSFKVNNDEVKKIVQRMKNNNKQLIIILGNHDKNIKGANNVAEYFKWLGFNEVKEAPFKFMEYEFSHEPVLVERPTDDLQGFTGSFPPVICIHGHTHSKMVDENYFLESKNIKTNPDRYINVCWDVEKKIYHLPEIMKLAEKKRLDYINSWRDRV